MTGTGLRGDMVVAVIRRDWAETRRNKLLLVTIVIPPVVLTIVPLLFGAIVRAQPLPPALAQQVLAQRPDWASLAPGELTEAFGVQQFLVYFLLMPAYIPLAIASYSIIGEKLSRSLEAVLATPIRTAELLAGKALAALAPGVLTGWLTYVVFAWLAGVVYGPHLGAIVTDGSWLAGAFLLGPAVGLVSVVAGVIVSSWVNDPRTAQQVGGVLIVPIVGLTIIQATGTVLLGAAGYVIGSIVLTIVGTAGLWAGARLFRRETILTRWR